MISDSARVNERLAQNEKRRADKAQKDLEKAESTFNERISNLEKSNLKRKSSDDDDDEDLPAVPRFLCRICKLFDGSILSGIATLIILSATENGFWGSKEED